MYRQKPPCVWIRALLTIISQIHLIQCSILIAGCTVNGGCYRNGETFYTGCNQYRCRASGLAWSTQFTGGRRKFHSIFKLLTHKEKTRNKKKISLLN